MGDSAASLDHDVPPLPDLDGPEYKLLLEFVELPLEGAEEQGCFGVAGGGLLQGELQVLGWVVLGPQLEAS
jgi:hypothetical protein